MSRYRLAVVLRGRGLSPAVRGSDPGDGAPSEKPLTPTPEDPADERAVRTAQALALFERRARKELSKHKVNRRREKKGLPPANCILTRGAGRLHQLVRLEEAGLPIRLACVSGDKTVLGIARWLGAKIISTPEMTANLDTDLDAKLQAAFKAFKKSDLVVVHVKGADIASHDRRPDQKAAFLERLDGALGRALEGHDGLLRVAVASDHATLSESGQHASDPLPVLVWGSGIEADETETFDEQAVGPGALERFPLQLLLSRLYQLS